MKTILKERKYQIDGNWYSPTQFLNTFKSVLKVELIDITSSAGDWSGIFFQLINGIVYGIPFSQENNYSKSSGFTLYTSEVFCSVDYSIWNNNIKEKLVKDFADMIYY